MRHFRVLVLFRKWLRGVVKDLGKRWNRSIRRSLEARGKRLGSVPSNPCYSGTAREKLAGHQRMKSKIQLSAQILKWC